MAIQVGGIIEMKRDGLDVTNGKSYEITKVESGNMIAFNDDAEEVHYWEYPSEDYEVISSGLDVWEKTAGNIPLEVGFKRLTDDAVIPTKAHASDSGFDLVASEDVVIEPGETEVVPTGISVQLPEGFEAQVRPRSGVTVKTKLRVQLGTIDNGYKGEIGVIVDNTNDIYRAKTLNHLELLNGDFSPITFSMYKEGAYLIRKGDRIAQLVVQSLPTVESVEVYDVEETERGAGGFGSTGV